MKQIILSVLLSLTAFSAQASEFSNYKSWLLNNIGSYELWSNKQKKKYQKLAAKEVVTNWKYKNKWKPGYFRFHKHTYNWGISKQLMVLTHYLHMQDLSVLKSNQTMMY